MFFKKRPVVIEAEQFGEDRPLPFEEVSAPLKLDQNGFYIQTLEGPMRVSEGDWVIRGIMGEFYPCKPDIFEATYERVEVHEKT